MKKVKIIFFFASLIFIFYNVSFSQQDFKEVFIIEDKTLNKLFEFKDSKLSTNFVYNNFNDKPEVFELKDNTGILIKADMDICTDGSPDEYQEHCSDPNKTCKDFNYQSETAYTIGGEPINADKISYLVLPNKLYSTWGFKKGDMGLIINGNTHKLIFAYFGEVGPKDKIGEASVYASKMIGHCPCITNSKGQNRIVGIDKNIYYVVFKNSKNLLSGVTQENVNQKVTELGLKLMKEYFDISLE